MNTVNISKIDSTPFDKIIERHKIFYRDYLLKHRTKHLQILNELNPILSKYQAMQGGGSFIMDKAYYEAEYSAEAFFKKYWGDALFRIFNKEVPYDKSRIKPVREDGFWAFFFSSLAASFEEGRLKHNAKISYKYNFLNFLRECLNCQGLHHLIHQRDKRIYKRLNILVAYRENRKEFITARSLLSQSELESDYLSPFYKGKPIFIHGKIIKASTITRLNITTTLFIDNAEIELFSIMKGFEWNTTKKDEIQFAQNCHDATNIYLKNPNAELLKKPFKNNSITYINSNRIKELIGIKTKKWDISRLISLCNELNQNSTMGSYIGVSALQRTIINYVPPIFGFKSFGQVVAQYKTGKSIKKSFENLNTSMKNIADHNLHAQASKADSLPNETQIDFSNDLDVLLAEVCKKLKS